MAEMLRMRKRLNVRLLVKLGIALVVLGGAVHALHAVQVNRQAREFLELGERAAAENRTGEALQNFGRYLVLRPDDVKAQCRYGIALAQAAATPAARWRAFNYLERVVGRTPDDVNVRQALGLLAVKLERYGDAVRHLTPLRGTSVDQAELEQTLAWCHEGAGETEKAADCWRNAIRHRPVRIEYYVRLAELRLRLNDADAARELMEEAVSANPKSADAFLARSRFRQSQGLLAEADSDLENACRLAPKDAGLRLERAELARSRDQLDQARTLLRQGIAEHDSDPRFVFALARLEHETGRLADARRLLDAPHKADASTEAERLALLAMVSLDLGDVAPAEKIAKQLESSTNPWFQYVRARLLMREDRWIEAARQLETTRTATGLLAWRMYVDLALAECYAATGEMLRRIQAARRAAAGDPASPLARQAYARTLFDAGRFEDALLEWEALTKRPKPPPAAWDGLARATIVMAELKPKDRPAWSEVDRVLTAAEKSSSDSVVHALLKARALRAWDQAGPADDLLQKTGLQFPNRPEPSLDQADVAIKRGDFATAQVYVRAAQEAVHGLTDGGALLTRARLGDAKAGLEAELTALPPREQQPVWRVLLDKARQRGDWREARRLAGKWATAVAFDIAPRQEILDVALQYGNDAQVGDAVAELRRLEGDDGIYWRCGEVQRLLGPIRRETGAAQQKLLTQAHDLLDDVIRLQPDWGRPLLLAAYLDEVEGNLDAALAHYQAAFERGEYTEPGVGRLVQLLIERRKLDEADRILSRYEEAVPGGLPASLSRTGAEVALELKDGPKAARLARRAVRADVNDHRDVLWQAGILDNAGQRADAETVLADARTRFSHVPEVWVSWLRFLRRTGQHERIDAALAEAQQRLSAARLPLEGLARCCEAAGKVDLAEKTYRQALATAPHDPFLNRALAQFYLFNDRPSDALPCLRKVIASSVAPDHEAWARRQSATSAFQQLVLDPSVSPWSAAAESEALKLLEENRSNGRVTPADERARALVLAVNPQRREEARKLFVQSQASAPLSADEQFRFAQLHDLLGDDSDAERLMEDLLEQYPDNAQYLAGAVRRLYQRNDRDGARKLLERLQKLESDSLRVRQLRGQ